MNSDLLGYRSESMTNLNYTTNPNVKRSPKKGGLSPKRGNVSPYKQNMLAQSHGSQGIINLKTTPQKDEDEYEEEDDL